MALPPVAWSTTLTPLIQDMAVTPGSDGKGCCRIDVDVGAETLRLLNEFEARARHRQVQIPLADGSGCVRGEMNTLVGLGRASDPSKVSKVMISFHNVSTGTIRNSVSGRSVAADQAIALAKRSPNRMAN